MLSTLFALALLATPQASANATLASTPSSTASINWAMPSRPRSSSSRPSMVSASA